MHLFYDSTLNTWRLITEKLPEKPESCSPSYDFSCEDRSEFRGVRHVCKCCAAEIDYTSAIAAIKQNALTVGNPEILFKTEEPVLINPILDDGKFYKWTGDFETQDINNHPDKDPNYVAILTLPEEKKNTMENLTKEQDYHCAKCGGNINHGEFVTFGVCDECFDKNYKELTASGSVAAPKEDTNDKGEERLLKTTSKQGLINLCISRKRQLASLRQQLKDKIDKEIRGDRMIVDLEHEKTVLKAQLKEREELIANLKQEIARLIEDVNKAYEH